MCERDEITLRDDKPTSVGQLNRKRLKPVVQAFLDILNDHMRDLMLPTAARQKENVKNGQGPPTAQTRLNSLYFGIISFRTDSRWNVVIKKTVGFGGTRFTPKPTFSSSEEKF